MNFIADPTLVLYLPLYELDGASFAAKDAYGHLCTVTGAVWRLDGHYFDGTDDRISLGNPSILRIAGNLTVEIWAKSGGTNPNFVAKTAYNDANFNYLLEMRTFYISDDAGNLKSVTFTTQKDDGEWHHIVGVYDDPNALGYADGVANGSNNIGSITLATTGGTDRNVYVGRRYYQTGWSYGKGNVGEVRIYNRALTPQEIQHNYLATKWRYR